MGMAYVAVKMKKQKLIGMAFRRKLTLYRSRISCKKTTSKD